VAYGLGRVVMLAWVGTHSKNTDSRAGASLSNGVDTVGCELVDLRATVKLLLLEWAVLKENNGE
jgi:hypothetical protein